VYDDVAFCTQPSAKSKGCVLRELVADSFFTAFQSTVNPDWYVGFNHQGHRLSGHYWIRHLAQKRCYNFVKMDRPLSNGNDSGDDNPLMSVARSQYLHRTLPPDDMSRPLGHPATT
jgi:Fibroblast growth factor